MADISTCPPLTRASVQEAHTKIKSYIHRTPVLTCQTITQIANTAQTTSDISTSGQDASLPPAKPRMNLFFKCENMQKIGAFKARGAFHALSRLSAAELSNGVVTHSSGNHAQALALAAKTFGVKAYVVMPSISTPSKIEGTKSHGAEVIFPGRRVRSGKRLLGGSLSGQVRDSSRLMIIQISFWDKVRWL